MHMDNDIKQFTEGQEVWIKLPAGKGIDDYCWHSGTVLATTAKRVKVTYDNGGGNRIVYNAPHNVRDINDNHLGE